MEKGLAKSLSILGDYISTVSWLSGSIPGKHLGISGTQAPSNFGYRKRGLCVSHVDFRRVTIHV